MQNVLFKRKTIPVDVNFLLWKQPTFNSASLIFFCIFPSKKFDCGENRKEPKLETKREKLQRKVPGITTALYLVELDSKTMDLK